MIPFTYTTHPQQIIFAPGALDQLPTLLAQHQRQRLLLITVPTMQRNGRIAHLHSLLADQLLATYPHSQPHVPQQNVHEVLKLATTHNIDAIIALGGGSPIGLAKALSHTLGSRGAEEQRGIETSKQSAVSSEQSPLSSLSVSQSPNLLSPSAPLLPRSPSPLLPIIAIPTTYAGSEMTPIFGVTQQDGDSIRKITTTDPAITPRLVLYDPELTLDLPPALTASSAINALAHCVEALYSITRHPLSTAAALEGIRLITAALPAAVADGSNLPAHTDLLAGAHLAAISVSSAKLALHHGLCHTLGGSAAVPHGVANAIILPHAMGYNLPVAIPQLAAAARALGLTGSDDHESATNALNFIADLIAQVSAATHLPQRLRDANVPQSVLPHLAQLALKSSAVQANPRPVTAADLEHLLHAAW